MKPSDKFAPKDLSAQERREIVRSERIQCRDEQRSPEDQERQDFFLGMLRAMKEQYLSEEHKRNFKEIRRRYGIESEE